MEELLKIKNQYVELSKGYIDYEKFNHYHITHHSTAIEGSTLSYQEGRGSCRYTFIFEALEETRNKQDPEIFRKFMFNESLKYFRGEIEVMTKSQELKQIKGKGLSFLF